MSLSTEDQKKHVMKIWARARANAFAHRAAATRFRCLARILFFMQILFGLTSLFLVVILYAFISDEAAIATGKTPLFLTLSSVFYTILAILITVMQNYIGYEEDAIEHNHNQHSFLYLAQRCREIDSPGMSLDHAQALIDDLERDFQILKVRGREPTDRDFRVGHNYLRGISDSQFAGLQTGKLAEIDGEAREFEMTDQDRPALKRTPLYEKAKTNQVYWFEIYTCFLVFAAFVVAYGVFAFATYQGIVYYYHHDLAAGLTAEGQTLNVDEQRRPSLVPRAD